MALRKQPDRRVKKKRKLETPKNFDINKRKTRKLEDPENFDIIGSLLCSYGLTGENLARDIFSYMDVSSIEEGRFVCKSWNIFLTNDKQLWMDILRQTLPYLEFLSSHLSDEDFADGKNIWKGHFDFVGKDDHHCCFKIIQLFKRIQMVQILFQDVIQDCPVPVYEVFQKEFIGEKLAGEIQSQIMEIHKYPKLPGYCYKFDYNAPFAWMLRHITNMKVRLSEVKWDDLYESDQNLKNLYELWLKQSKTEYKAGQKLLLLGMEVTLLS
jgi:hypothetical protein